MNDSDMLTTAGAAKEYGVSPAVICGWCRSGDLPHTMGKSALKRPTYLIKRADLNAFKRSRAEAKDAVAAGKQSVRQLEEVNGRFTIKRAAVLVGIPANTLSNYVNNGRVKAEKNGRVYYIARADIDALILSLKPPLDEDGKSMINVNQAAEYIGSDVATVRRLIRHGDITAVSHDSKYYLSTAAADKIISDRLERKRVVNKNKRKRTGRKKRAVKRASPIAVSTTKAAAVLAVSRQVVTRMCQDGTLTAVQVGRLWSIDKQSLAKLVSARKAEATLVKKSGKKKETFASGTVSPPSSGSHKKINKERELADNRAAIAAQEAGVRSGKIVPIFLPAGVKNVNDRAAGRWRPGTAAHKRRHGSKPLASVKDSVHVLED